MKFTILEHHRTTDSAESSHRNAHLSGYRPSGSLALSFVVALVLGFPSLLVEGFVGFTTPEHHQTSAPPKKGSWAYQFIHQTSEPPPPKKWREADSQRISRVNHRGRDFGCVPHRRQVLGRWPVAQSERSLWRNGSEHGEARNGDGHQNTFV